MLLWGLFLFSACNGDRNSTADRLNEISYSWHYTNLDSAEAYAIKAYNASKNYDNGKAEALNNLAFTQIMHMDYGRARHNLILASQITDNQIELLIADIQLMRICQRESSNKEFYDYHERATRRITRIDEQQDELNAHLQRRLIYAKSELAIVTSTYYYYVGLERQSQAAIDSLANYDALARDSAQLVNYYYNVGSGGIVNEGTQEQIDQTEFDFLMRSYLLALDKGYTFFIANSLQALSEHLTQKSRRDRIIRDNIPAIRYLNIDNVPDSLLAGNLAERSLQLFKQYGDPYQTAGSYRTLASCYQAIGDYPNAIICLNNALGQDTIINKAPDLVASIREQLSVAWSSLNNKPRSDYNRNIYLDLQESTRQDRYLEARAAQLDRSAATLNIWIGAVITVIFLVIILLILFSRLRQKAGRRFDEARLLKPLRQWENENQKAADNHRQIIETLSEDIMTAENQLAQLKRVNIEQRAKIQFVKSMLPLVDRMKLELSRLNNRQETDSVRHDRIEYIRELAQTLNSMNNTLTEWIQLRKGQLGIHVESFALQHLFTMLSGASVNFSLNGITLKVETTDAVVKADRVLTLFMLNTLADNARKFTPAGGTITISARDKDSMVEITVCDTGCGIAPEKLSTIFDPKYLADQNLNTDGMERSHGYGLMTCKGIIDKYRKTSHIFSQCSIKAESEVGKGSRFSFTLPHGILRVLMPLLFLLPLSVQAMPSHLLRTAAAYADSAYYSNIQGKYGRAVVFADSALHSLNTFLKDKTTTNKYYRSLHPLTLQGNISEKYPEIAWLHAGIPIDYKVLLDVRNECAVAALALHRWDLYEYNNRVYTQLFREFSADNTLAQYCRTMQRAEQNKNVAIILLILLLVGIGPAYYFIYYRHVLYFRFCMEKVSELNSLLVSHASTATKLKRISSLPVERFPQQLAKVVEMIKASLEHWTCEYSNATERETELRDYLSRLRYETDRLHISNSTTDNCLSSLKHETMYYPARISLLAAEGEEHLAEMTELTSYYEALFSALLGQALSLLSPVRYRPEQCQFGNTGCKVVADPVMADFLLALLRKHNGAEEPLMRAECKDGYVTIEATLNNLHTSSEEALTLFSTEHAKPDFLVCRQIVRDCGEMTRHLACGISAHVSGNGVIVRMKLPGQQQKEQ